jgi:DNA polymerase-3 subunit gamma/tau
MSFLVTARKWRPQRFDEVVGQEHITVTLKNAIKNNRIAHAYLFTGPRGVGKTSTARLLAKALNCLNLKDSEPCNECEMCRSIQSGQSLDIIEIDGASNRGIDEVRTLRDSVKYPPTKGRFKIYIIDEVHMLTKESFNAFLKTLEEPPAHTIFIFATTDIHKVPLTIISRCQRFDFRRIQLDTIKSLLSKIAENEKIKIEDKTLTIIAKKSDGALRDAESFFDQIVSFCGNEIDSETVAKMLNLIDDDIYFSISDAVLTKNFKIVFDVTKIIYENGWNFIDFMEGLLEHFRNIMTVVISKNSDFIETADIYKSKYLEYKDKFSEGDLLRLLNFLNKAQQELRFSQNQKLKVEVTLSHLIGLEKSSTISELLSTINNSFNQEPNDQNIQYSSKNNSVKEVRESASTSEEGFITKSASNLKEKKNLSFDSYKEENYNHFPSEANFNFDYVVKKWQGFVELVRSEKGLILGPFIQSIKPINLEGNKLNVFSEDPFGKDTLKGNEEYLSKKTEAYFGKKLIFSYTSQNQSKANNDAAKQINSTNVADEEDPIIKAIIENLGGEELK